MAVIAETIDRDHRGPCYLWMMWRLVSNPRKWRGEWRRPEGLVLKTDRRQWYTCVWEKGMSMSRNKDIYANKDLCKCPGSMFEKEVMAISDEK